MSQRQTLWPQLTEDIDVESIFAYPEFYINKYIFTHPVAVKDFFKEAIIIIKAIPNICVMFDIDTVYRNVSGTKTIGQERITNELVRYYGHRLYPFHLPRGKQIQLQSMVSKLTSKSSNKENKNILLLMDDDLNFPVFLKDSQIIKVIQDHYSKIIGYVGGNSQRYTREVKPPKRDIKIKRKLVFHNLQIDFQIHLEGVTITSKDTSMWNHHLFFCVNCKLFKKSDPKFCICCEKILCYNCTRTQRALIFIKKNYCPDCYKKTENEKKMEATKNKLVLKYNKARYKAHKKSKAVKRMRVTHPTHKK